MDSKNESAADKLRRIRHESSLVEVELEVFRGHIAAVKIPRGVRVRIFDYDVLELGGDDQILRKPRHSDKPEACMVNDMEAT